MAGGTIMAVKTASATIGVTASVPATGAMPFYTPLAIAYAIEDRLIADSRLQNTMGSQFTQVFYGMAFQDADLPYMVHRCNDSMWPMEPVTYFLDFWDYNISPQRIMAAVERVKELLDMWRITTDANEIGAGRMEFFSGALIPSDNEQIWHYATQWTIRFIRKRETH